MKIALVVLGLGATVMVVLAVQAVRQELSLRALKTRTSQNILDAQNKEGSIAEMKRKASEQSSVLNAVQGKLDGLRMKKAELEKTKLDSEASLKTCAEEKARLEL